MNHPTDYSNPAWLERDPYTWKRFVPDQVREIWDTFTEPQKQALACWADQLCDESLDRF